MNRFLRRTLAAVLALMMLFGGALAEDAALLDELEAPVEEQEVMLLDDTEDEAQPEVLTEMTVEDEDDTAPELTAEEEPDEAVSEALDAEDAVKKVLDPVTIAVGMTKSLDIPVAGTQYKSNNTKVLTVGLDTGIMKGVKAGTAIIAARVPGYGDVTCNVTVKSAPSKVTLNQTKLSLKPGSTARLTGKLSPTGALTTVTFTSSDSTVAKVDDNGLVTALNPGTTTVTVRTHNGKTAKCSITVTGTILPTSIALGTTEATLYVKNTLTLKGTIQPAKAKATLTFTSSNTAVATVSTKGKVTAKQAGHATITVTTQNGLSASCDITVNTPPTKIALSRSTATLGIGETLTLDTALQPADAVTTLKWSSSKSSVAKVSDGTVTGVKAGTATITVKTANGKKATCKITVKKTATPKLALQAAKTQLRVGDSTTVTANLSVMAWRVEGSAVSVDQSGRVKAVAPGQAAVWALAANGDTANVVITVEKAEEPEPDPEPDDEPADERYIIDISQYDGNINFDKLAPAVSLVIMRATLSTQEDTKFATYARELTARGIPFGVYCYSKATNTSQAKAEAKQFYSVAKGYKPKFYVLDAEYSSLNQSILIAFAEQLRASGAKKMGCYIAHDKYKTFGYDDIRSLFDFTWIPRYGKNDGTLKNSTKPSYLCDLWQYTDKGSMPGIIGDVDMNVITGDGKPLSWFIS